MALARGGPGEVYRGRQDEIAGTRRRAHQAAVRDHGEREALGVWRRDSGAHMSSELLPGACREKKERKLLSQGQLGPASHSQPGPMYHYSTTVTPPGSPDNQMW